MDLVSRVICSLVDQNGSSWVIDLLMLLQERVICSLVDLMQRVHLGHSDDPTGDPRMGYLPRQHPYAAAHLAKQMVEYPLVVKVFLVCDHHLAQECQSMPSH